MVWEGREVVKTGRMILGATNPLASQPGTIRGDYAIVSNAQSQQCSIRKRWILQPGYITTLIEPVYRKRSWTVAARTTYIELLLTVSPTGRWPQRLPRFRRR